MPLVPAAAFDPAVSAAQAEAVSPLVLVDLDDTVPGYAAPRIPGAVTVGIAHGQWRPGLQPFVGGLDCTLVPYGSGSDRAGLNSGERSAVKVPDVDAAAASVIERVSKAPQAASVLAGLLRVTESAPVTDGLFAESLAYSMLLSGPEFARWLTSHSARPESETVGQPVLVERSDAVLAVTLNRPGRRNAFNRHVRDRLVEVLDLVALDDSVAEVHVRGAGPAFCSGGDLDEFGTATDVVRAHQIRIERSVAARIHAVSKRVHAHLHGACIGAGIELPSFAGRIIARSDTIIALPELDLGLVPGAGGTVGITSRIGRWRCAYLVLSGARIDAATALSWGLVDEVTNRD